jgi:hypothetical protein
MNQPYAPRPRPRPGYRREQRLARSDFRHTRQAMAPLMKAAGLLAVVGLLFWMVS